MGDCEGEEKVKKEYIEAGKFEIEVGGDRIPARASLGAMYDPQARRMRD